MLSKTGLQDGGSIAQWLALLLPTQLPGFEFKHSPIFSKIIDIAEVNQWHWSVDSGLKMLIQPILHWLVASQYYKKNKSTSRWSWYFRAVSEAVSHQLC